MDELRWVLLVIGGVAIAGVYGFTRWQDQRRKSRRGRSDAFSDDVDIEQALRDMDHVVAERDPLDVQSDDFDVVRITRSQEPAAPEPVAEDEAPAVDDDIADALLSEEPLGLDDKVVVLNVAATDGRLFDGKTLTDALKAVDMSFGEHEIYHRILDTSKGQVVLFSAADILQPGTFAPERIDQIESPGLVMFLQLPGPYDGLAAFEQMLEGARQVAEILDAKLLDERRCSLTNQAIEHIREELREYRRLTHLMMRKGGG